MTYDEWATALMAQEGLTSWDSRDNSAFTDERPYRTHWSFWAYAPGAGDLMDESNYHAILGMFEGLDAEHGESDDWFNGSVGHWTYSSYEVFYVRPYAEDGQPTKAGELAYDISQSLADYPILDEDDWSKRESDQFDEDMRDYILPEVKKESGVDFDDDVDDRLWDRFENRAYQMIAEDAWRADDVRFDDVKRVGRAFRGYRDSVRDRYYSVVAATHLVVDREVEDATYYALIGE